MDELSPRSSAAAPVLLGFAIGVGCVLLHIAFDALFSFVWGFPSGQQPVWRDDAWWMEFVNATLIAYLPAAQWIARRGVDRDLTELRPHFPSDDVSDDAGFAVLRERLTGAERPAVKVLGLSGLAIGAGITFADPSISGGVNPSLGAPVFLWALARTMIFVWLVTRLAIYDLNATRTYMSLGRSTLEVDLLDVRSLAPFARRGQRSALTWVLFSSIFSLFWIDNSAAQVNFPFVVAMLVMATWAFLGPLVALRGNILAVKHAELDCLLDEIRVERRKEGAGDRPRLANAVAYYQLVSGAREWPVDAENLLKFVGYLLLGLGSWLGGAVVERVLETALQG